MFSKLFVSPGKHRLKISSERSESSKHSPIVTVIIPAHNYGEYISEAIESVLKQTYRNIEVIVVDDGSTDDTREIVAKYPLARYVFQEHRGNMTPARAKNLGIELSRGNYICFTDADDKLSPMYVEKCVSEIEKDRRIGFVWAGKQEFGESNQVYMPRKLRHISCILAGAGGALGPMLVRREAYVDTLHDENLHGREDWDMAIRLMRKGWKWKTIQEALVCVRVHEQSLTVRAHEKEYVHELEGKYPLMKLYAALHDFFRALVLLLENPKLFLLKLWNRRVSRYFRLRRMTKL